MEIELRWLEGDRLIFEATTKQGTETGSLLLDKKSKRFISEVFKERPFKSESDSPYTWNVEEVLRSNTSPHWQIIIKIARGKSRKKRKIEVSESIYLNFYRLFHSQRLPSQLEVGLPGSEIT
ncbi:hypothetical protein [Microbulbifer sp. Q7]|uniref:hypothetical protein n=1 Tax=Microbulbifer sp. Q7 TaxID=1785091 RepID=UPI001290242F|nr:hypothetical protein [Microbulbifer sp. Q7]